MCLQVLPGTGLGWGTGDSGCTIRICCIRSSEEINRPSGPGMMASDSSSVVSNSPAQQENKTCRASIWNWKIHWLYLSKELITHIAVSKAEKFNRKWNLNACLEKWTVTILLISRAKILYKPNTWCISVDHANLNIELHIIGSTVKILLERGKQMYIYMYTGI